MLVFRLKKINLSRIDSTVLGLAIKHMRNFNAFFDKMASLKIQFLLQHFVARKKCFLTYQTYAASPFFIHASFCLEL